MDISVENLTMNYHDACKVVRVFANLSLKIPDGTSAALVGRSGIGKTTLLNIIAGLERPVAGRVVVGGTEITSGALSEDGLARFRGANIGYIFQFHHLFPELDARENVALPLLIQRVSREQAYTRAEELLGRVGLADRITHRPGTLSGGEQQRVAIARALCPNPGVLLADEPTGNLDYATGVEISNLLLEIQRQQGLSLLVVTHSAELASLMDCRVEMTPDGLVERG